MMLVAGEETEPPDVTYPLEVNGWYALYVGMYSRGGRRTAQVRLSNDPCFATVLHQHNSNFQSRTVDIFWKSADLTGQDIVFRRGNAGDEAYLPYVKLVPLSEAEAETLQAEQGNKEMKRLYAHHDLSGLYFQTEADISADDIRHFVEPYRHTDFTRLYYEFAMGDVCSYFTDIGRPWTAVCAEGKGGRAKRTSAAARTKLSRYI